MVHIVIATHGSFAQGLEQSARMILGDFESLGIVSLTPQMGPQELREGLLRAVGLSQEVLFLVDLWGGTPFNQVRLLVEEPGHEGWAAVSGLNLPMLVAALTEREGRDVRELAAVVTEEARAGIRALPDALDSRQRQASAPQQAPGAASTAGSAAGGHMDIALVRVDSRLLHGQVATAWTKAVSPDRIIVCSDGVAHDELRRSMIEQAAPPGVRAHVVPLDKIIAVYHDARFAGMRAMLLFETCQDLLRVIEGGVPITRVNLGSMAHSVGKVVVSNVLAMDADDVRTLERMASQGVTFDVRKVPSDTPMSFESILKKAQSLVGAQTPQP